MASNSASANAWCVSLVAAILVLVGDKGKPGLLWIAAVPALLFFFLDAYYLALERGFRNTYQDFVEALHGGTLSTQSLFQIRPRGYNTGLIFNAMFSPSVIPFYGAVVATIGVTAYLLKLGMS